jgi:hypothetical protein
MQLHQERFGSRETSLSKTDLPERKLSFDISFTRRGVNVDAGFFELRRPLAAI